MAKAYTSEDFDDALASHEGRTSACVDYRSKVAAALQIAAAAYKPGVIETALRWQDMSGFVIPQNAAAIRLALLKDSSNG